MGEERPRQGAVVDELEGELSEVMEALARAGLAEAFVMLRRVEELSEGQRHRLEIARAMLKAQAAARRGKLAVVIADEFLAKLDRTTALGVARMVAKWVGKTRQERGSVPFLSEPKKGTYPRGGVCWVAASSHDDLLEVLEPDVLVMVGLGGQMEVVRKDARA